MLSLMFALYPCLEKVINELKRGSITKEALDTLVSNALAESKERASTESRKSQWEVMLKDEVFKLAATEGLALKDLNTTYYDDIRDRLDLVLAFTEHDACEQTFPFTVLQDLLESQTIKSCSHIFSWIEERSDRLTEGMVPQKGKALVLLRTLNDLLRRLSKTGTTTVFCGRILTFLSGVFPLGERSGVNLRGEYGPLWEGVSYREDVKEGIDMMDVDETSGLPQDVMQIDDQPAEKKDDKPEVKPTPTQPAADRTEEDKKQSPSATESTEEEKKRDFFYTFWSLQRPFSRPPLFSQADTLAAFKAAVDAVMPVIKEATTKERAMMGSKAVVGQLKRKRDEPAVPTTLTDEPNRNYFFAKFLTSPELLDLELSDTGFRRQFLFQLLILLSHLLQFTKAQKGKWTSNRNRSLQMDFTLEPADAKWAQETVSKAFEELRQTSPNGRAFADTVQAILEREKNWVRWKNDLCNTFDKEPLHVSIFDSTAPMRAKMREEPEPYKHRLGSAALTDIWDFGYRDIQDIQRFSSQGEVKDFVKKIEAENVKIATRKQMIERARASAAAKVAASAAVATATPAGTGAAEAAAAAIPASSPPLPLTPAPQRATATQLTGASPLHPSLPAKPVTTDARPDTPVAKAAPGASVPPSPAPAPVVPTPVSVPVPVVLTPAGPLDPLIAGAEENKSRYAWLALRTARDDYLHHFGKIGTGDITLLAQEIAKEAEQGQRGEVTGLNVDSATGAGAERGISPTGSGDGKGSTSADDDVKMEDSKSSG